MAQELKDEPEQERGEKVRDAQCTCIDLCLSPAHPKQGCKLYEKQVDEELMEGA